MARTAFRNAPGRERGIVLLAMLTLVLMAASGVVLVGLRSAAQNQLDTDENTTRALAAARQALIGWAVAEPDFPGGLPFPDRNGDGDYDGNSDCTSVTALPAGTPTPDIAIGRLPWRGLTTPCQNTSLGGLSSNLRDGAGEGLWYAVSANLLRVGDCSNVIPPQVDWAEPFGTHLPPGTTCPPPALPSPFPKTPFNWLTVLDANGAVLSDRVAFVVIAPGARVWRGDLPGSDKLQDRSGAAPNAKNYLDRVTVGGTTYDNADSDGVFIMAPDNTRGPDGVPSGTDGFNDRLVYVTVDELLPLIAERVLKVVAEALQNYQGMNNAYPWAAPFEDPALSLYKSTEPSAPPTERAGLVPIMIPGETFQTPFTVQWGLMSNAIVDADDTVTVADLNNGATFTPPGDGTCVWEFDFRINCSNTAVAVGASVANGEMTPWGVPCPEFRCERRYNLTTDVRIERAPAIFTIPIATETRTRAVSVTKPRTPSSSFGVQIRDYTCTGVCPGGENEVGHGTLTIGPTTDGIVSISGVRHELAVVDRVLFPNTITHKAELPHWFVTAGWYRRILMAVASGLEPGGAGFCTPGTTCLEVDTLDATSAVTSTADNVAALVVFAGWPIAANTGTSSQPRFYFEADNLDADERFSRPASLAVRDALEAAGTFNDQLRVVAP